MHLEIDQQRRNLRRISRFRWPTLVAICVATLISSSAWSQPHSVSGVKEGDVLNIQKDIDHTLDINNSEVIGAIPHDAVDVIVTGLSVDIGGTTWREIYYDGTLGWVNARYLKPSNLLLEPPVALQCAGTEPFWNLVIDENDNTLVSPDIESQIKLEYRRVAPGIGRSDLWAHYLDSADGTYTLTTIVRYTEACSDGMSDLTYDYEALLLGLSPSGSPAYGCCSIMY